MKSVLQVFTSIFCLSILVTSCKITNDATPESTVSPISNDEECQTNTDKNCNTEKATYSQVATGGNTICAIRSDGVLKCWGGNEAGSVGDGTNLEAKLPTEIDIGTKYKMVDVGNEGGWPHSCGITINGVLKCWGDNTYGQLGDGTTTNRYTPTVIDAGTEYKSISISGNGSSAHSCGITVSGQLRCWGKNIYGQLGDGGVGSFSKLSPVIADNAMNYKTISVGHEYTCGITTADTLRCWGQNSNYRQLGTGNNLNKNTPTPIDPGTIYKAVVASYSQTCSITTNSVLKCWGTGYFGNGGGSSLQASPIVIDSGVNYDTIGVGPGAICGITESRNLKCWGSNGWGEVGNGTRNIQNSPQAIDANSKYIQVSVGGGQACGITEDGILKCWGAVNIGNGDPNGSLVPFVIDP